MTKVYGEKGKGRFYLCCEGHAESSAACNYVTGAMYAFAGYAMNFSEVEQVEIDEEKPRFLVECRGDERVEAAFDAAVIGLLQLEVSHKDEIKVKIKNF